jgi:hypothetical protein
MSVNRTGRMAASGYTPPCAVCKKQVYTPATRTREGFLLATSSFHVPNSWVMIRANRLKNFRVSPEDESWVSFVHSQWSWHLRLPLSF